MFGGKLAAAVIATSALTVALAGTALGNSAAQQAAGAQAGTWGGTIENKKLSFAEGSYTTKIVVQALRGRITLVVATVRMECPETSVWDARVSKGFRAGTGPKLTASGGFFVTVPTVDGPFSKAGANVKVSGALKAGGGSGTASARADGEGCSGSGSWHARRIN
jgi:hypothetical protein